MRLPVKPGQLPATTTSLPMRWPRATAASSTAGAVSCPRTTSSSFITCAGLKKCSPNTCSGRPVTAAMASMSSAEVLLARIASGLSVLSRVRKISCLSARFSYTASITRSASASSV
ncbi:hypothetical protein D3C73_1131440 [compost metagenome]